MADNQQLPTNTRRRSTPKRRIIYPIGSISHGTMRPEDLIPEFTNHLSSLAKQSGLVPHKQRTAHLKLAREIESRLEGIAPLHTPSEIHKQEVTQTACASCGLDIENLRPYPKGQWRDRGNNTHCPIDDYYQSEDSDSDLEALFDALECYSAPYFYFGAHPGDGADYGWWLSEGWDDEFETIYAATGPTSLDISEWRKGTWSIKVFDLADVPEWYRGEIAVVSDHGNVSLYVKTSRKLTEIWSVV